MKKQPFGNPFRFSRKLKAKLSLLLSFAMALPHFNLKDFVNLKDFASLFVFAAATHSVEAYPSPLPTAPGTRPDTSLADAQRDAARDRFNESLRAHNAAIAEKREAARLKRQQAREMAEAVIEEMRRAFETMNPARAGKLGKLEPEVPEAPAGPVEIPPPTRTPGGTSSILRSPKIYALLNLMTLAYAFDPPLAALASREVLPTFPFTRSTITQSVNQIIRQQNFVLELGGIAGRLSAPIPPFLTFGKAITSDPTLATTDILQAARTVAATHRVNKENTASVVALHLNVAVEEAQRPAPVAPVAPPAVPVDSGARRGHFTLDNNEFLGENFGLPAISNQAQLDIVPGKLRMDLNESVQKVNNVLRTALQGLRTAKGLEDEADRLDREANNLAKNPPKSPSNANQQPQQEDQGQQGGDGKGDDKNKDQKPPQMAQVPFPGPIPDARGLFDAATKEPVTPSVAAVAEASKFERGANPNFGGLPPGIGLPPILRSTASPQLAAATSGTPAPTNLIPGAAVTGNALDRSFFDNKNDIVGGGGDKPPSFGGAVTGGAAGASFGGQDIGQGIGPSYGGRAGLSDALKTIAYGTGGGVNTSEVSATINTGADAAFPPQVLAQITSGKKMKDGPGKGAVGLMGQVFSLVQTQCRDNTQRGRMEDFCGNVTQVAARAQTKAFLANDQPPRRDLASERGAVSSK